MTGRQVRLSVSRRIVRCDACGAELGRIWDNGVGERHLLFENSMALKKGIWTKTRRARRAEHFGRAPYRRAMPITRLVTPGVKVDVAVGLEPTSYPVRVRCSRCGLTQSIEAAAIGVTTPEDDGNPEPVSWPLSEPFNRIGEADGD
jgi:hypothetical protein